MSQKIVLIDAGNSRIKWAFCSTKESSQSEIFLQHGQATHSDFLDYWPKHLNPEDPPQKIIISNVAGETLAKQIINQMKPQYCIPIEFVKTTAMACGIRNSYKQPHRLGIDRWLALIAAWNSTQQPVCVVDCGTATTLDVVDEQGRHLGGLILPGMETMQRALIKETTDLPHTGEKSTTDFTHLLAQNTEQAITLGITHSLVALIEKIYHHYPSFTLIVTGGLADQLLNTGLLPKAIHRPNLVLHGLKIHTLDHR